MEGLEVIPDVAMIIGIHVGTPGTPEYIRVILTPWKCLCGAPQLMAVTMPASGQLVSMLLPSGASQYELIQFLWNCYDRDGFTVLYNLTIVIFVILSNISSSITSTKKAPAEEVAIMSNDIWVWIGAILTLGTYSVLYKDSPV